MATPVNVINLSGEYGGLYIGDTNAHAGNWMSYLALTDTVLASATACNVTGLPASGATIKAGVLVSGVFTSITLTSGTGIAYKRKS